MVEVETREKWAAGATEISDATVKGKVVEFAWWMKKQGYRPSTIKGRAGKLKRLADLGANIFDPESVKEVIAKHSGWNDGSKRNAVTAYTCFLTMVGGTWEAPCFKIPDTLPFIPLESEIDALINGCGKKMGCFLQGLKDTGADPGELATLEWTHINYEAKSVTISHPVKGHNARVVPVSDAFLGRLSAMPKTSEKVFSPTVPTLWSNFTPQRQHCARDLSNPRILKITFTTLRHWKGTMEYHKTKDPYHVKKILGHKHLSSTEIYINLEAAVFAPNSDEFTCNVAEDSEEAVKLIEVGFEYVGKIHGVEMFKRRK